MLVLEHTVVGTIVPADNGVLISNTQMGGTIQSSLGIIKVSYPDLGKLDRIHTLKFSCLIGIIPLRHTRGGRVHLPPLEDIEHILSII